MIGRFLWRGLLLALVLVVLYQLWIFMHILWWVDHNPTNTAFMRGSLSVLRAENSKATLKHEWVEYSRISRHLKRAVIASEDAKFTGHEGFDWDGIQKAYEKNRQKGRIVAGGSTISQQLAKNLFLSNKRTPWRKLEEVVITWMLERMMSKRRIFEIYLNVIEWGNGVFGAEAAARHYYKTSAANLTAAQSARMAAMIPNPRYYDKHREARGLVRKTGIVEARMRQAAVP